MENISAEKTIIPLEITDKTTFIKFKLLGENSTVKFRVKSTKKLEYDNALKYETEQTNISYSTKTLPKISYTIPEFNKNNQSRYALV